jgi:hypothetical protein
VVSALTALTTISAGLVLTVEPAFADTVVIEDTDQSRVEYSAGWNRCAVPACPDGSKAPDGSFMWTGTNYASMTLRFHGTRIILFGTKEPWSNIATVSIDGGPPVDVDFYANPRTESLPIWTSPGLAASDHTLVMTKTHRRNPLSSGGDAITFDRAEVTSGQPDATPPASPPRLTAAPAGPHRIYLDWTDSAETDFASYSVYRSTAPDFPVSPSTLIAPGVTASRLFDTGLPASTTYYYKVTAIDMSGNESAPSARAQATTTQAPAVAAIEDSDVGTGVGQVRYSIHWNPCTTTCDKTRDGSYMWTGTNGAAATIRFDGTRIVLFGIKEPWSNIAEVSLDGGPPIDVDFYSEIQTDSVLVWTSPVLTPGTHTLVITKTPRRNPASGGGDAITFDRAWVFNWQLSQHN